MGGGVGIGVFFEDEAAVLERGDDGRGGFGGDENVIGEVGGDEEDRAASMSVRINSGHQQGTHIPAVASGLVRSSTLCPASKLSPST